jgi:hypothetical protein
MSVVGDTNPTTAWPPREGDYDFDAIARVAGHVELTDIRLHGSTIRIEIRPGDVNEEWGSDAYIGFHTELQEESASEQGFRLNGLFSCVFKRSWRDEVFTDMPPISDDDPPEIEIDADFELAYSCKTDREFAIEDLNQFAYVNGTLHAWPYWRELAESAAQRMGLPRLVVGVFKVPSTHDPSNGEQSE